jgi:hypothetical protein
MERANAISHSHNSFLAETTACRVIQFPALQSFDKAKMDPEMARLQVLSDPEMMARLRQVCLSCSPTAKRPADHVQINPQLAGTIP